MKRLVLMPVSFDFLAQAVDAEPPNRNIRDAPRVPCTSFEAAYAFAFAQTGTNHLL